jgi:actin-related protein
MQSTRGSDPTLKSEKQSQNHIDELTTRELEELEEIKKKEKMRLDQELIEFNKRGGFERVLQDLFYNPDPISLEFDSVYKLKQL